MMGGKKKYIIIFGSFTEPFNSLVAEFRDELQRKVEINLPPTLKSAAALPCENSLRFNGHFPGGPGLAGTRMSPFWILLELRVMEVVVTTGAIRCKLKSKCHQQQTNTQV